MIDLKFLQENPEIAKCIKLEISGADLAQFAEAVQKKAVEESQKNLPKESETYLTPAELADLLKVSLVTLWSYDRKGLTLPLYIGKNKRYRKSDIEKSFLQ